MCSGTHSSSLSHLMGAEPCFPRSQGQVWEWVAWVLLLHLASFLPVPDLGFVLCHLKTSLSLHSLL